MKPPGRLRIALGWSFPDYVQNELNQEELPMAKYARLTKHLTMDAPGKWTVSFEEIEVILGFGLPASARRHPSWWSNQWHSQGRGWLMAGFQASGVNLENETVTFRKSADPSCNVPAPDLALAKTVVARLLNKKASQVLVLVQA